MQEEDNLLRLKPVIAQDVQQPPEHTPNYSDLTAISVTTIELPNDQADTLMRALLDSSHYGVPGTATFRLHRRNKRTGTRKITFLYQPEL